MLSHKRDHYCGLLTEKTLEVRYDGDNAYIDFCPFSGPVSIR